MCKTILIIHTYINNNTNTTQTRTTHIKHTSRYNIKQHTQQQNIITKTNKQKQHQTQLHTQHTNNKRQQTQTTCNKQTQPNRNIIQTQQQINTQVQTTQINTSPTTYIYMISKHNKKKQIKSRHTNTHTQPSNKTQHNNNNINT